MGISAVIVELIAAVLGVEESSETICTADGPGRLSNDSLFTFTNSEFFFFFFFDLLLASSLSFPIFCEFSLEGIFSMLLDLGFLSSTTSNISLLSVLEATSASFLITSLTSFDTD